MDSERLIRATAWIPMEWDPSSQLSVRMAAGGMRQKHPMKRVDRVDPEQGPPCTVSYDVFEKNC